MARDAMTRSISQGIEYAAALPEYLLDASSTMRKLFGVVEVVLSLARPAGGPPPDCHGLMGCIFIMGGVLLFASGSS